MDYNVFFLYKTVFIFHKTGISWNNTSKKFTLLKLSYAQINLARLLKPLTF